MNESLKIELAALRAMTAAQLREKYREVFGEPSRSGNKAFLFKRVAWRLQSLAEGSLSDRARRRAAELAREADLRATMPRSTKPSAGSERRVLAVPSLTDTRLPMPGAVLTRSYRGRVIEVMVLPKGFEWNGQVYRSLSGVAKAVTGSHWNGPLFFGLKEPAKR